MTRKKQAKKTTVKLIPRVDKQGVLHETYEIMGGLIGEYHEHLKEAKVALAWRFGWKEDADGRLRLGQAKKASDLDRELHHYDFVILLNHDVFFELSPGKFTVAQKAALIDHELCHCEVTIDDDGAVVLAANRRPAWRVRKHDIEEFHEVVERHGCYVSSIGQFAKAALAKKRRPLFDEPDPKDADAELEATTKHPKDDDADAEAA